MNTKQNSIQAQLSSSGMVAHTLNSSAEEAEQMISELEASLRN